MYILLALIAAVSIGVGVHFAVPHRTTRGVTVAPAIAAGTAAAVYAICTWSGLGEGSIWTWIASLLVPAVVAWAATTLLTRYRVRHDAERARAAGIA